MKPLKKGLLLFSLLGLTKGMQAQMTPPGNALNFAGGSTVTVDNTLGNFGTGDFTIENWARQASTVPNSSVYSKRGGCHSDNFIQLNIVNGKPIFEIDGNSGNYYTISGSSTVNDGRWHHFAVVRSSNILYLYVDGQLATPPLTMPSNPNLSSSYVFTIGNSVCNVPFVGGMDELRFYNAALSKAEICADMFSTSSSKPANLISYYNFDQGTAGGNNAAVTSLIDSKAAHNGTLNGFALTGQTSNWVESYAMVVPKAAAATNIFPTGFTANWNAPVIGTANNYFLDVSSTPDFSSILPAYNNLSVSGTSQTVTGIDLNPMSSYYYRVRANKGSSSPVTGQGGNSRTGAAIFGIGQTYTFSLQTTGNDSATLFTGLNGISFTSDVNYRPTVMPVTCTFDKMNILGTISNMNGGDTTGRTSNTITITLYKNGVATNMKASITVNTLGVAVLQTDNSHPISVMEGDRIAIAFRQTNGLPLVQLSVAVHAL